MEILHDFGKEKEKEEEGEEERKRRWRGERGTQGLRFM